MTTAQEILTMIEGVDPSDKARLDEIDGRVWCFLKHQEYGQVLHEMVNVPQWTRCRTHLKAIRPKGWIFDHYDDRLDNGFRTVASKRHAPCLKSGLRKTEELAELHAIIQAIEHERGKYLTPSNPDDAEVG